MNYDTYETVSTPDFTGDHARSFIQLRDIASHLQPIQNTFPGLENEDVVSFEYSPVDFSGEKLNSFQTICQSPKVKELFKRAKQFQKNTGLRWNSNIDKPTLSIYLGLLGIDEAASKECGAITLDLLLRAGILIEGKDGAGCWPRIRSLDVFICMVTPKRLKI